MKENSSSSDCIALSNPYKNLYLQREVGVVKGVPLSLVGGPLSYDLSPEELIVCKVHLTSGVVETEAIAFSWEVQPFRMTKLIPYEVEVGLSPQAHSDESVGGQYIQQCSY